jgi:type IV pilus assembly protein PilY1
VAAAAASATSSPNVTQTDNQIFSTTYETNTWSGKVFSQLIDPATGNVGTAIQWQADGQLISKVSAASDTRVLYTFDGSAGSKLKPFTWATLSTAEQAFFLNKCVPASTMTQCAGLGAGALTTANDGSSLVGFLRGWQGNEATVFRDRTYIDQANNNAVVQTVLGDTISAKPAYLRRPQFNYADAVTPAYSTFLAANLTRSRACSSARTTATCTPRRQHRRGEMGLRAARLLPALYALTGYATLHATADGRRRPATFDAPRRAGRSWWRRVRRRRGYYAVDVDPDNPKACVLQRLDAVRRPDDLGLTATRSASAARRQWVVVVTWG